MAGKSKKVYLFVDGYNIIFAWNDLNSIAQTNLEDARIKLLDTLSDYQGFSGHEIIVVFDAHRVKNNSPVIEGYDGLSVVYTKENETADNYIERCASILSRDYRVRVATSDSLEQIIILGRGAERISANDLLEELKSAKTTQRKQFIEKRPIKQNMLMDNLDPKLQSLLEKMRRAKDD